MDVALPENRKLITTADAAKILGVTMGRVRQLAKVGKRKGGLKGHVVTTRFMVFDEAEVLAFKDARPARGRPPGGFKAN